MSKYETRLADIGLFLPSPMKLPPGVVLPAPWVNGKDLIALGINEGPELGKWKQRAYDQQLSGEIADKESLLAWVKEEWRGL